MPPRKRPPQPITNVGTAMLPPSIRMALKSEPAPAPAAASVSASAPPVPPISGNILEILPESQRKIYELVYAAGSNGIWMQSLRLALNMTVPTAAKHTGALIALGILKEVTNVRQRWKKVFMDARIEPSTEITGGFWYHNGKIDPDALAAACRSCLVQVDKLGAATPDMVCNGIVREDPRSEYTIDQVREVLRTMVLDRVVEECRSTGEGEFSAVRAGMVCYRRCCAPQGGTMEGIPWGVCPRIAECSPGGVISPITCVYFKKWLQMDF